MLPTLRRKKSLLIVCIVACVSLGVYLLLRASAATETIGVEAELMTRGAHVTEVYPPGSSGGKAIALNTVPAGPVPAGDKLVRGVNDHPLWIDFGLEGSLNLYGQANVQAVRVDLQWQVLQPVAKGQWDPVYIKRVDDFINGANARGIKVLAIPVFAPGWANGGQAYNSSSVDPVKYADFIEDLMVRYGDKIEAYEIWNEPAITGTFWVNGDGASYANLLKVAYTRIKQRDPTRLVLGASLYDSVYTNPAFLRQMYANGAKGHFDVLSQHTYGDDGLRAASFGHSTFPASYVPMVEAIKTNIVSIMAEYGEGDKPIWLTETGINTATNRAVGSTYEDSATGMRQIADIIKAGEQLPTLQRLYWYTWSDAPEIGFDHVNKRDSSYGIIKELGDGSMGDDGWAPKQPIFDTLKGL